MDKILPLILIEPTARQKQRNLAELILKGSVNYSQEEVKLRLKKIRCYSVDNVRELAERLYQSITNYSNTHVTFVKDATEAVNYITNVTQEIKTITSGHIPNRRYCSQVFE